MMKPQQKNIKQPHEGEVVSRSSGEESSSSSKVLFKKLSARILLPVALLSLVSTLFALPRPTVPHVLPLAPFDLQLAHEREAAEQELAQAAADGHLSNSIRAVGEQLRRIGKQLAERKFADTQLMQSLKQDAALLAQDQQPALLQLRALQAELFIQATHEAIEQGKTNLELEELGGGFSSILFSSWIDAQGAPVLGDHELRLMYRRHWNEVTGLSSHPAFAASLEEIRRYYGTLLLHPPTQGPDPMQRVRFQLAYAQALGRADPQFDSRLLEGILQLRLMQPHAAQPLLENYLSAHPHGAYSHLARGHLQLARRNIQLALNSFF